MVKDGFLSTMSSLTCFSHIHSHSHEPDPRNSEKPQKGDGGGGQSSICQNFIFNPELHSSNQLPKKQSTCPVSHLFSCQFCGCSLRVSRNEGLCINTTAEQGAVFLPHLWEIPDLPSPVLQFLALQTDICYFQFHNLLVRCITAHMAQALRINTCGRLHFNHWTLATFFFLMQCNSSGLSSQPSGMTKSNKINVSQAQTTVPPYPCHLPSTPAHQQMHKLGSVGRIL